MSDNYELSVTPHELDVLIYGITLVGLTSTSGKEALTPEEQAADDNLHAFYERLTDMRAEREGGYFDMDTLFALLASQDDDSEPPF